MTNYTIMFKASAKKELKKLDKKYAEKVLTAICNFATGQKPCDVKKMQGMENHYRVRVNDYRILIEVIIIDNIAEVYRIASRGGVYKK